MPEMIPVANQIQPPNAGQTLSNLSSIYGIQQQQLGLQQQRQQLQTGQYLQQTAGAESEQAQQKNRELQALSQFTANASKDPSYLNPDGSLNTTKFQQDASKVAPTYGQEYIGQSTRNANEAVLNRKALLGLSVEQRKTAGEYLGAEAANPDASHASWQDAVQRARDLSPDKGYQSMLDSMLTHAPQTAGMPDAQASQSIRDFARQVAVQVGAPNASLSQPTYADYRAPGVGGKPGPIAQRQTNIMSPAPLGAVPGSQVASGLAPTETPSQAGAVAAATSRATGTAGIDVQRAGQVSAGVQPSRAAIPLTEEIDSLADQIKSGKFAGYISQQAANLGVTEATRARQILEKDLGQVETRATDFGNPTDKKLGTILSGFPQSTSDPQTIHSAMDYIRGTFKQNVVRGQNLLSHQKDHPDLAGFQQADDKLTSTQDPLQTEYKSLNFEGQKSFLKRRFPNKEAAYGFVNSLGKTGP